MGIAIPVGVEWSKRGMVICQFSMACLGGGCVGWFWGPLAIDKRAVESLLLRFAGATGRFGSPERILERVLLERTSRHEEGAGAAHVAKSLPRLPVMKADALESCGAVTF